MTDERPQGGDLPPDPDFAPPAAPPPPAQPPAWSPPAAAQPPAPPPLAPYVNQGATPQPPPPPAPGAWTAPPIAPPAAQPAVAWATAPAAAPAQGGRTILAAIAGIVMLVGGILFGLLGIFVAVVGGSVLGNLGDFTEIPEFEGTDPSAILAGAAAFIGIVLALYSLLYVIGGIGVLRSRGWGRVIGIVVGILSGLFWLTGVTSPVPSGFEGAQSGFLFAVVMVAIHAYIAVVLLVFWRNKPSG